MNNAPFLASFNAVLTRIYGCAINISPEVQHALVKYFS